MITNGEIWPDEIYWSKGNQKFKCTITVNGYISSNITNKEIVSNRFESFKEMKPCDTYLEEYNHAFNLALFNTTVKHILNGDI